MKIMKTKEWNYVGNIDNPICGRGFVFQHKKHLEYVVVQSAKIVINLGLVLILSMKAGENVLQFSEYTLQTHPDLTNSFESLESVLTEDERPLLEASTV